MTSVCQWKWARLWHSWDASLCHGQSRYAKPLSFWAAFFVAAFLQIFCEIVSGKLKRCRAAHLIVSRRPDTIGRSWARLTRQGPAGIYNRRQSQPSFYWSSEYNGAKMVTLNSAVNHSTAADNIVIAAKIMNGQDANSARNWDGSWQNSLTPPGSSRSTFRSTAWPSTG